MGRRAQWTDITLRGSPAGEFSRVIVYLELQRLWRRAPLSTGTLLSIMEVRSPGTLRDSLKGGSGNGASLSLYGCSVKGTWRGGSFAGDPEAYVEVSGDGHLSLGTPLGNLEGGSSTGDFER